MPGRSTPTSWSSRSAPTRPRRHARTRRGRQRVLLGRGRVDAARRAARFEGGPAIVGVCGKPFKCPPAPSETALLLHDFLVARGRRAAPEISVVMPFGTPIPPSPDTSRGDPRGVRGARHHVRERHAREGARSRRARWRVLSDGTRDAVRAVPRRPGASRAAGGRRVGTGAHPHDWVPVNKQTLETQVSRRVRRRRRQRRRHAEGGRLRRRCGAGRGGGDHRAAQAAGQRRTPTRGRLVLRRVRARPGRARGRGFPERPEADRARSRRRPKRWWRRRLISVRAGPALVRARVGGEGLRAVC